MWEQRASALIEAGDAIERLVKLDPRNAAGHYLRASLWLALGEVDEAITSLEYSLSLNPTYFAATPSSAASKSTRDERTNPSVIEEAIRLIHPEPNILVLYFSADMAALHIADDRAAAQWLLKARQANRSVLLSAQFLAVAYLGIEEEAAARTSLAEFLKETPKFSIVAGKRLHPTRNPVVAKQRERIFNAWLDWVFLRTRPLWEIDSTQPGAPFPILYEIRAKRGWCPCADAPGMSAPYAAPAGPSAAAS